MGTTTWVRCKNDAVYTKNHMHTFSCTQTVFYKGKVISDNAHTLFILQTYTCSIIGQLKSQMVRKGEKKYTIWHEPKLPLNSIMLFFMKSFNNKLLQSLKNLNVLDDITILLQTAPWTTRFLNRPKELQLKKTSQI